ncbi:uncharacterized protein LOC110729179 [Chenopodium quinoa]|uniref:uncharacterized protein LOC110729179 n=1 Tax=Chenopodium quinoa TaxID=63459 RepID=UPI000B776BFF|nr:uncharacterized protein LOC110729179 [Chenopodium quinoa]
MQALLHLVRRGSGQSFVQLGPPPIKIGPGRPRKNRIKGPYELPKKPGTPSMVGMEMTCSICMVKDHSKRRCPNKDSPVVKEPQPKRPRGKPTHSVGTASIITPTPATQTASSVAPPTHQHHTSIANPTQLGRGGRKITTGEGSRGGRGGIGSSTRGGRGAIGGGRSKEKVPAGVGVYFATDGSVVTNPSKSNKRARRVTEPQMHGTQSSQTSNLHQPTQ